MMILLLKWNLFASTLQNFVYVEHGPLFVWLSVIGQYLTYINAMHFMIDFAA